MEESSSRSSSSTRMDWEAIVKLGAGGFIKGSLLYSIPAAIISRGFSKAHLRRYAAPQALVNLPQTINSACFITVRLQSGVWLRIFVW